LERASGRAPKSKGGHLRKEFEYTRHGTTTLIAAVNVENGKLIHSKLGPTRNEIDYADFTKQVVDGLPKLDKVVLMADQLNTHLSESLVKWIAEDQGYDQHELGIKGKSGYLKDKETRRAFLEKPEHRIRFIFTPKHCSWLNPIENWFAKLQRHVIKNGNFSTVKELEYKIEAYIIFHNNCFAKPLKWKFKGFNKTKKLANLTIQ
jgi:transposase